MKRLVSGVEIYLLASMFFFVPIGETVKSIFLGLFFIYWVYLVFIKKTIPLMVDVWDMLILSGITLLVFSTAFSGIKGTEWRASVDIFRLMLFLYMIKSLRFEKSDTDRIVFAIITGTIIACVFMFWFQYASAWFRGLSLISIGSENTSAVYLSMISILIISYIATYYRLMQRHLKPLIIISLFITVSALVMTGSRAGFGAFIAALLLIATISYRKNWKLYVALVTIPISLVLVAFLLKLEVVYEFYDEFISGGFLKIRLELWKYALIAGMKYPLFGLGAGNYDAVTADQIYQWAKELNLAGDWGISRKQYWHSHAHNIFLQAFVERGIAGVIFLTSILAAWLIAIVKCYKLYIKTEQSHLYFIWFSNVGAFVTIVLTGFVVTGFHHENGLIVMMLFGVMLSFIRDEKSEGRKFNKS